MEEGTRGICPPFPLKDELIEQTTTSYCTEETIVFRVGNDHRKADYKALSFLTNRSLTLSERVLQVQTETGRGYSTRLG